jgi:hypothetical protein
MFISKLPRLWTPWSGSLGRVGRLMAGPPYSSPPSPGDLVLMVLNLIRVAICDLVLALTLKCCDLKYFKLYDRFLLLISKSLYILIQ